MRRTFAFIFGAFAALTMTLFTANVGFAQTFEPGVDRPGADFSNFDIPGRGPHTCQSACFRNGDCLAWTYVRAGFQGPFARCWLKSGVPGARGNSCCVSGIMPR
ncbi:MAG: PAN domain-containing protein [Beijerinckiaceae bacterium]